jgi:hypothetical protein
MCNIICNTPTLLCSRHSALCFLNVHDYNFVKTRLQTGMETYDWANFIRAEAICFPRKRDLR